jgi:FAD/FMN-containing dehydrogenase
MVRMQIWNAAISCTPAEVVPCSTVDQVRAALATAAARQLPVSVLGGGHDWAGRAIRSGGLVIDLTPMRLVQVTGDIGTVGGGARSGDVMAAAQEHGLAVAAGTVGAVGMTGLALGGGYGPLCGTAGLVADTIVGADVALADGRFVSADQATEPDLYWALRGGGGNFGVVTALRLRLHPVPTVLTAMVLFGWDQAAEVLSGFAVLAADAPRFRCRAASGSGGRR